MKRCIILLLTVSVGLCAHAGIVGWVTSKPCDWPFIERTGGIRIREPVEREGHLVLPVEYCIQGTVAITRPPEQLNSALAVRKIEVKKRDIRLVIRVISQVVENGSNTGRLHYARLDDLPVGSYEVFYETAGDPKKLLGRIEIK